jgi:hypothetical protein
MKTERCRGLVGLAMALVLVALLSMIIGGTGCSKAPGGKLGVAPYESVNVSALRADAGLDASGALPVVIGANGVGYAGPISSFNISPPDDASAGTSPVFNLSMGVNDITIGSMVYGAGEGGFGSFDGHTVVTGFTLTGGDGGSPLYTQTADAFLAGGHVFPTVTVYTAGFRIFSTLTFTIDATGTVENDGLPASGATGGAATPFGSLSNGVAGGNGHTGSGAGSAGSAQGSGLSGYNEIGGNGGGATTADAGTTNGGLGGAYTQQGAASGGSHWFIPKLSGYLFGLSSSSHQPQTYAIGGGAGGGGGGSASAGATGGGGGGGAGLLILHVLNLVNNGSIHANGGACAAASGTGNAGGGGGGGAGNVFQISRFRTGVGTATANGAPGCAGIGTGETGTAGGNGNVAQHRF